VVDVKYAVAVVRTTAVPKDCVIVHRSYWVQLWAPREADKLSSQALNHLFRVCFQLR
jgi:hypothetical protein